MYYVPCWCQCRYPYYVHPAMSNLLTPQSNSDRSTTGGLLSTNNYDEQSAYWSSPRTTEYAKLLQLLVKQQEARLKNYEKALYLR